ncbi:hypothetical protein [Petralouisia muris]|nr:hypothetical protein [Petralouisia muris]
MENKKLYRRDEILGKWKDVKETKEIILKQFLFSTSAQNVIHKFARYAEK